MDEKKLDCLLKEALCPPVADEEIQVFHKEAKRRMNSKKRVLLAALAACMMIGTTAIAAGKVTAYVSGSHLKQYSYEELDKAQADAGFTIRELPKVFSNGYCFDESTVQDWHSLDDQHNTVGGFREINAQYTKGGTLLWFHIDQVRSDGAGADDPEPVEVQTIGDTEVKAYTYHYKFVPTDYQLTAEDEVFEAIPGNEISVGSDKVQLIDMSAVIFDVDGIEYSIMDHAGTDHIADMMDMAEEILR